MSIVMSAAYPEPFAQEDISRVVNDKGSTLPWPELPLRACQTEGFSLVFVVDREHNQILLGSKKRGYGRGLIHGFGGKIEAEETIGQCARRELWEEAGLRVTDNDMARKGRLIFVRPANGTHRAVIDIAVFVVEHWEGSPIETEEMCPAWYPLNDIPFDKMWPDVRLYFPPLAQLIGSQKDEQLLVRVDYDNVLTDALTDFPPLSKIGIRKEDDRYDEAIVNYWVGLSKA